MPLRSLILVFAAACACIAPAGAAGRDPGLPVTGEFTGIARATRPQGNAPWDGATVTGRFSLQVPRGPWWEPGAPSDPPSGRLTFDLAGQRFAFDAGPDQVDAPGHVSIGGPPGQSLSFLTDPRPRDHGAIVTFGSDDGRLWRDDDFFSSLAIDGQTVSWLTASFSDGVLGLDVVVDVQAFRFGSVTSPASEPPALALLAAGLVAIAGWRIRRPGARPG